MPTFDAEERFRQEYRRLSVQKQAAFLKARDDFFAWLVAKKKQPDLAPPVHLRLHFIESKNAWSITFGGDLRAVALRQRNYARRSAHHLVRYWRA